jgi:hypothetical protein
MVSFGGFDILVFVLSVGVLLAISIIKKITAPFRFLLTLLSLALFCYFLYSTGLFSLGLSGVLSIAKGATSLFGDLTTFLARKVMGG